MLWETSIENCVLRLKWAMNQVCTTNRSRDMEFWLILATFLKNRPKMRLPVGGKMGNFSMFIILIQIIKKMQKTLCCNYVMVYQFIDWTITTKIHFHVMMVSVSYVFKTFGGDEWSVKIEDGKMEVESRYRHIVNSKLGSRVLQY